MFDQASPTRRRSKVSRKIAGRASPWRGFVHLQEHEKRGVHGLAHASHGLRSGIKRPERGDHFSGPFPQRHGKTFDPVGISGIGAVAEEQDPCFRPQRFCPRDQVVVLLGTRKRNSANDLARVPMPLTESLYHRVRGIILCFQDEGYGVRRIALFQQGVQNPLLIGEGTFHRHEDFERWNRQATVITTPAIVRTYLLHRKQHCRPQGQDRES